MKFKFLLVPAGQIISKYLLSSCWMVSRGPFMKRKLLSKLRAGPLVYAASTIVRNVCFLLSIW